MAYFRNTTVNLLNLHYGLQALAVRGSGAFFGVFLLKSGVAVPHVLGAVALILLGRLLIRPSVLVLAKRCGLRPLVIAGTLVTGLEYPLLAEVDGVGTMLFALVALSAVGETFYWTTYHAYFASLGDPEHRGHQIGAREALAAVVGIVGPLAAGWALTVFGPRVAFGVTAVVLILAALPLLWTPNVGVSSRVSGASTASMPGVLLFAADAWYQVGFVHVWQIALFVSLGESFSAFGGAMALAAVVGAASGLVLGRLVDLGHGGRAIWIAFAAISLTTALRAASVGDAGLAIIANACGGMVGCLYVPAFGTAIYNQARRSPCALRFHIAAEMGWDLGGATALLASAMLIAAGMPIGSAILLSLLGTAAVLVQLRRYYAGARGPTPQAGGHALADPARDRRTRN